MADPASGNEVKKLTKTQLFANIAEKTELSRKEVSAMFDALEEEIAFAISSKGPGEITIPGL
ncbi:MAG: HU family DNA-binding protein, partial [bacterium]|nr:HU family DNA-binding protein [bacterium]